MNVDNLNIIDDIIRDEQYKLKKVGTTEQKIVNSRKKYWEYTGAYRMRFVTQITNTAKTI